MMLKIRVHRNIVFGLGIMWDRYTESDIYGGHSQRLTSVKIVVGNLLVTIREKYRDSYS